MTLCQILSNEKLFKYGMTESSLCDFCNTSTELIFAYSGNALIYNRFGVKLLRCQMKN